jgi:hypothetical protein
MWWKTPSYGSPISIYKSFISACIGKPNKFAFCFRRHLIQNKDGWGVSHAIQMSPVLLLITTDIRSRQRQIISRTCPLSHISWDNRNHEQLFYRKLETVIKQTTKTYRSSCNNLTEIKRNRITYLFKPYKITNDIFLFDTTLYGFHIDL